MGPEPPGMLESTDVLVDFIRGKQYICKDGQLVYKSDIQN